MEAYTIVNRTSKTLQGVWNGRHYELKPYESREFEDLVCYAFKKQNPQMGSLDPRSGMITFLVGIKEIGDPCEPLDKEKETVIDPTTGKPAVEVWDCTKLTGARPSEVVAGDNGLYSLKDWKQPQNRDVGFVDPDGNR